MKMSRVVVGEVGGMQAKQSKTLYLVFIIFLRSPVGTRGFMGGEWGEGEFSLCSKYWFVFQLKHTTICYACDAPLGLLSHPGE